ncbi:MAG: ATP synthase subunit I [Gammaproteobacteria bacterium]|nr:ATP synthase subunit I [Gammaproteobacteria bacterium]NIR43263.1 ATP synthase subunit I [Gemmatimonadota bacterium]NIR96583.1 ATP synthase subunit I [Gammaproteobacteria bacterium]NIT62721.1 ATP synthase subunit I [Gammaproteobacteria bacterium]NIV19679.1 ATP synthase subunit I [Gammaproteobacteria bacterium]
MEISLTDLVLALAAGMAFGAVYLMGLWLTVRRLPRASHPGLLALGSLVVRLGLLLGGLFLVADGQWQRIVIALAGFLLIRTVLVRRLGPPARTGKAA